MVSSCPTPAEIHTSKTNTKTTTKGYRNKRTIVQLLHSGHSGPEARFDRREERTQENRNVCTYVISEMSVSGGIARRASSTASATRSNLRFAIVVSTTTMQSKPCDAPWAPLTFPFSSRYSKTSRCPSAAAALPDTDAAGDRPFSPQNAQRRRGDGRLVETLSSEL